MNTTTEISWSNELGSRDRRPWLLLIKDDAVAAFAGKDIPGLVVVKGNDYHQNGKWSHTIYRLVLASGVRAISGHDGWETGRFIEGLAKTNSLTHVDTWAECAKALGVTVQSAQEFLRGWRPKAATALDAVDGALDAIDSEEAGVTTLAISFGGPTRRQIAEGFWTRSIVILSKDGDKLGSVAPEKGKEWGETSIATEGIKVLRSSRSGGMKGGYQNLLLATPEGATWEFQREE